MGARDVHVSLEGCDAFTGPVGDGLARVLRAGEFVYLRKHRARTFKIRASDIHFGAGNHSLVNPLLEVQVGVGFDAAGSAHGGYSGSQVESGIAVNHFVEGDAAGGQLAILSEDIPRGIEHVTVHVDQAGNYCASVHIKNSCITR